MTDGFETHIGTNHLGHFALAGRLLPALYRSAAPRIITVSAQSARGQTLNLDDRVAYKKSRNGALTGIQQRFNKAHNGLRAIGERANSLLKTTFKALRNISVCPWKIGKIVSAALVLLHTEHDRTT